MAVVGVVGPEAPLTCEVGQTIQEVVEILALAEGTNQAEHHTAFRESRDRVRKPAGLVDHIFDLEEEDNNMEKVAAVGTEVVGVVAETEPEKPEVPGTAADENHSNVAT